MPSVSVVIPIYNALGQIEPLLNQFVTRSMGNGMPTSSIYPDIEVILTDDASPDGSAIRLASQYPSFTIIAGERNVGFGANVMRGVEAATGEYLFLLNSDVEPCGDPIGPLVDLLERDGAVFAAMPLIYNTHLGMVENLARLYCHRGLCWHTELTEQAEWTAEVRQSLTGGTGTSGCEPWPTGVSAPPVPAVLCGAAFLCKRERFLQLGGFDSRYRPFYWEDVALGFAAARRGWRCLTVPQSLVIHRHSESISAKVGERKLRYLLLNQLRFVHQFSRDLYSLGLRHERLWWLARGLRALGGGDLEMAAAYLRASIL